MTRLSWRQVRWHRLRRSGLVTPFDSAVETTRALIGVQAQMLPAAGISVMHRTRDAFTLEDLDAALHRERTLLKLWGQRHTLHLYDPAEWPTLHAAFWPHMTWWDRAIGKRYDDVADYEADFASILELLESEGSITRSLLRERLPNLHEMLLSSWGGVFSALVGQGHACHAGQAGGEGVFAARSRWLPELAWDPPARDEADASLAARFFSTYGPATLRDLAYWRSVSLKTARPWFDALSGELEEVDVEGTPMWALRADLESMRSTPPPAARWPARLLYRFDPLLLTHKDKSWLLLDPDHRTSVWKKAGHIDPVVLILGRIHGTWRYDQRRGSLDVSVKLFEAPSKRARRQLERDAERIADFQGLPLGTLSFS